ncbi:hypothetical protein DID75_00810 [Candidatus Marinamargulisbacteria bacterium SCGC AG-410-N11]|nr:hypothetical protein DID75_00810 [Candidatus Marinamargulisbacteria bacterium SCGC AG-410-N11]
MPSIIALVNQKGGVGKTTSAINISASIAKTLQNQNSTKRVLLVDMDPQANATQIFSTTTDNDISIYNLLMNYSNTKSAKSDVNITKLTQSTYIENLDICPSNVLLSSADLDLVNIHGRETVLKRIFKDNEDTLSKYEYIIIDCQPSLGLLTINSIVAADNLIVPLKADVFSLTGLELLLETVNNLQSVFDIDSTLLGFFFTQVNNRESMFQESFSLCNEYYGSLLFQEYIRNNVGIDHANAMDQSIIDYDINCTAAQDYLNLSHSLINRLN